MLRTIGVPALALGAVLALNGIASADDAPTKSSFGTTMTLGGQGTAAQAAGADDTELTGGYYGGYRGGYGGYRGGYYGGYRGGYYGGGWGYRGGYYGGYRGYGYGWGGYGYRGWGGYYGGYRPYYGLSIGFGYPYWGGYGYRPYYGGWGGSYIGYSSYSYGYGGWGGGYCGISGTGDDGGAAIVSLNMAVTKNPVVGTFKADGDAAKAAPQLVTPTNLPVSFQKETNPYTFKAYGEK